MWKHQPMNSVCRDFLLKGIAPIRQRAAACYGGRECLMGYRNARVVPE